MRREHQGGVHPVVIWPFVEAIRRLGIELPALPDLSADHARGGQRMSHERARTLLELAIAFTQRADLGLLAAEAVEPGHFELVELASRAQATVGQGLQTLAALVPILHEGLLVKLMRAPGTSRLRITLRGDLKLHPAGYDFIVASLLIAGRRQTRLAQLLPTRVRLPYSLPAHEPVLGRLLTCPLEFDAAALELEFPTASLDLPLARADASLGQVLSDAARELLHNAHDQSTLQQAVRQLLRDGPHASATSATMLARKLHMSERTLRRRLDSEGMGLRAIVDDVRRELAIEKLADAALSTEAIAEQLGFTTSQAFHRAFRRWTGKTVQAFRGRPSTRKG